MPVRFNPTGHLDVATDPSDLPMELAGKTAIAGGMTRCTNLTLDRAGIASTRKGSTRLNSSALATPIYRIVEQAGVRYAFAGENIYQDEIAIATGLTSAAWGAIKYNAYNVTEQSVFALNGTDRKRVTGGNVYEWGIDAPVAAPSVSGSAADVGVACTYEWEATYSAGTTTDYTLDATLKVYLPFDDGAGTGSLTDYVGSKVFTAAGGAAASSTRDKFGSHSCYFGGSSGRITTGDHADFDFSDGTWTVDCFARIDDSETGNHALWFQSTNTSNYIRFFLDNGAFSFTPTFEIYASGAPVLSLVSGTSYAVGTVAWRHYCMVEDGDTYSMYVDGVRVATTTSTARPANYTGSFYIGSSNLSDEKDLTGYVDEFRVFNAAKYSGASFSVPTEAYRSALSRQLVGTSQQVGTVYTEDATYTHILDWEHYQLLDGSSGPADAAAFKYVWYFETNPNYSSGDTYAIQYTYCRKSGDTLECESNPSGVTYVSATGAIVVTWPAPTDPQVTHVRVYRSLSGETATYYATEYSVGLLSASLTKTDEELGTSAETDHDRPPLGTILAGPDFQGNCFIAVGNLLYFCKPNQPEYWPSNYYVEVSTPSDPITAVLILAGQLYCLTRTDVYLIQGTGFQSFFPLRQSAVTGGLSHDGALAIRGKGIIRMANDGVWVFAGASDDNITAPRFRPVFAGTDCGSIQGLNQSEADASWIIVWRGKLYLGFPGGTDTYPGEVLVMQMDSGRVEHYDYGRTFSCVTVDTTNDRILAGDSSGYMWVLEDADATGDNGTDITWDYQSGEVTDQVRMYFPRSAKYDVNVGTGAAANAYVVVDGVIRQTHVLTGERQTRKRLIATCTGRRLQTRITGTGSVDIYAAEVE